VTCEKPDYEQPQPPNVYPVTLGGPTEVPGSCVVPDYEQPQEQPVFPVSVDGYRTPSVASPIPTGRIYECFAGQPGTISALLTSAPEPRGRLSLLSGPVGRIKVIP